MVIEKLGIRFPDNDFSNTVRTVLDLFSKSFKILETDNPIDLVKERLKNRINASLKGVCEIVQTYKFDDVLDEQLETYLQIDSKNIFINDEVDTHIENCNGWDNFEFHILYMNHCKRTYICSI